LRKPTARLAPFLPKKVGSKPFGRNTAQKKDKNKIFSLFSKIFVKEGSKMNDRKLWVQMLDKIARPVLSALAEDRLKETFPLWDEEEPTPEHPRTIAYLEAQARLFHGIAPWLDAEVSDPEERALQAEYREECKQDICRCYADGEGYPSLKISPGYQESLSVRPEGDFVNLVLSALRDIPADVLRKTFF
jgi:hypothetical protein